MAPFSGMQSCQNTCPLPLRRVRRAEPPRLVRDCADPTFSDNGAKDKQEGLLRHPICHSREPEAYANCPVPGIIFPVEVKDPMSYSWLYVPMLHKQWQWAGFLLHQVSAGECRHPQPENASYCQWLPTGGLRLFLAFK
jgi:hypothetical protein